VGQNAYAGPTSGGYEWKTEVHWDDLLGNEAQGTGGGALTLAAFRDTPFKMAAFRGSPQNDELHMRYQLPHRWHPGTEVNFHFHCVPLTDPAAIQVAYFTGQYVWAPYATEIPANVGWTQFTHSLLIYPGEGNTHQITSLFRDTPADSVLESSVLLIYVKRAASNIADTYAGDLAILSIDLHCRQDKLGTINEFPVP